MKFSITLIFLVILYLCLVSNIISKKFTNCDKLFFENDFRGANNCYIENGIDKKTRVDIRYNNAFSLFKMRKLEKAKKEFEDIILTKKAPEYIIQSSKENIKKIEAIEMELEKIKKETLERKKTAKADTGDYLADLEEVSVWMNPSNLKVYYNPQDKKALLIKIAFQRWGSALGSYIDFKFVDDIKDSDISAKTVSKKEVEKICQNKNAIGCTPAKYNYYSNIPEKTFMEKADIYIALDDGRGFENNDDLYFGTLLHEIGHALGIHSHSKSKGDVMYPDTSGYTVSSGSLSKRDVNTVKLLYGEL